MVIYTCNQCGKKYNRKSSYDNHINRKMPCQPLSINNSKNTPIGFTEFPMTYCCKDCDIIFTRKDSLTRHLKSTNHCKKYKQNNSKINNDNIKTNGGNVNQIIGDHNSIVINNNNNYYLLPFGQEEINNLTAEDKLCIFSADDNPIMMIIYKTNLNPDTPEFHNVGYKDLDKGYGYIYDGTFWNQKGIQLIIHELLASKEKDLLKIFDEIKEFLSQDFIENVKKKLYNIKFIVHPDHLHKKDKKDLVASIRKILYNYRHILCDSMKKIPGKPKESTTKYKITDEERLKEGVTPEIMGKLIKRKKIKKEIALDLLDKISDDINKNQYQILKNIIDKMENSNDLEIVIRLLTKSYYFGDIVSEIIINNNIQKEIEINKLVFG